MSQQNHISYFIGSLITSLVGAYFLIFFDFAETEDYNYTYRYYHFDLFDLSKEEVLATTLVLGIILIALLYCIYVSLKGVINPSSVSRNELNGGYLASIFAISLMIIGTLVFLWIASTGDLDDYWLEEGFTGGSIGCLLTFILFKMHVGKTKQN